jgi:hypothetical protein
MYQKNILRYIGQDSYQGLASFVASIFSTSTAKHQRNSSQAGQMGKIW